MYVVFVDFEFLEDVSFCPFLSHIPAFLTYFWILWGWTVSNVVYDSSMILLRKVVHEQLVPIFEASFALSFKIYSSCCVRHLRQAYCHFQPS